VTADQQLKERFVNKAKFSRMVEANVRAKRQPYLDAILEVCEHTGIDVLDVRRYLNAQIKDKLYHQAAALNLVEQDSSNNPLTLG